MKKTKQNQCKISYRRLDICLSLAFCQFVIIVSLLNLQAFWSKQHVLLSTDTNRFSQS